RHTIFDCDWSSDVCSSDLLLHRGQEFERLLAAMKKAGGALNDAGVPFVLGGGLACWARGAPKTEHDVDFLIKPEDAERAQQTLEIGRASCRARGGAARDAC